jgi:glycosyltransferase involved in cell wall biosynthesis
MSYALAAMSPQDTTIRLLDTRGRSLHPALSLIPLVRAWSALLRLGLTRRLDVAHINMSSHGSSIRKPLMLWTCRLLRIPVVLHLHASEYPEFFDRLPHLPKAFLRSTFSNADLVLVLGLRWKDYIRRELGVPAEKVTVLLNASPGPDTLPAVRTPRSGPLRLLFLGRLGNRKGVPEILQALADSRVRDKAWTATLAGDGEIGLYRRAAERLGLGDRVLFPGWVAADDAHQLLVESDLLLLPSHAEGLPMSVIEAFAHGVPVVSTPVGALPDIFEDGVNGLLVQTGNTAGLAEALLTVLEDEPLRLRLGQNARRTWETRLNIASYARELTLCWHRVCGRETPAH